MAKYLKLFNEHSEYKSFILTDDFIRPNVSYCIEENEVHYNLYVHNYSKDYLTFKPLEDGTFSFSNSINYSIDNGQTWVNLASNTATPTISAGSKIMWKASGLTPTSDVGIGTFSSTGKFDVEGNAMSLVGGDSFVETTTMLSYQFFRLFMNCVNLVSAKHLILPVTTLASTSYCYAYMFQDCTSLTSAPELPAETLTGGCYSHMFSGCTSLTTAPELPALKLVNSCYESMFSRCTSLTTAPALPATTLAIYCYQSMFSRCTSLTTAPALPATTLVNYCYQYMFNGCTSLTTAPELPALKLANSCYSNMFYGCTSLTTAPTLSATTLRSECYDLMFYGCTSLKTAPELPATTLANSCYGGMFYGCTSLNYIKALFTTPPNVMYTSYWVYNVATTGTFVKNSAATWTTTGVSGIPNGWTVQTADN